MTKYEKTPLEQHWEKLVNRYKHFRYLAYIMLGTEIAVTLLIMLHFVICDVLPKQYGISPRWLTGQSMQPTHYEGDLIFVDTNVNIADLDFGDIIVFKAPQESSSETICHRVYNFDENGEVITHGDHNTSNDRNTTNDDTLVGKVILHVPHMGWIVHNRELLFKIVLLAFPCATIAILALYASDKVRKDIDKLRPTYNAFLTNRVIHGQMTVI